MSTEGVAFVIFHKKKIILHCPIIRIGIFSSFFFYYKTYYMFDHLPSMLYQCVKSSSKFQTFTWLEDSSSASPLIEWEPSSIARGEIEFKLIFKNEQSTLVFCNWFTKKPLTCSCRTSSVHNSGWRISRAVRRTNNRSSGGGAAEEATSPKREHGRPAFINRTNCGASACH
jgi:hypothetical protein